MRFLEQGFYWFFVLFSAPLSFYFLLFVWDREQSGGWWALAALKLGNLVFLAVDYLIVVWLIGSRWPPVLSRIALTVVLAAIGLGALFGSGLIVVKRQDLQGWARGRPPKSDLIQDSFEKGPADAVEDAIGTAITRWLLRLPVGWLGMALIPAMFATWIGFATGSLWVTGSLVVPNPPGYVAYSYGMAVFEHLAYYVFWGGLLIGGLVGAIRAMLQKRGDVRELLALTAVSIAFLAIFVVFQGLWP